MIKAINFSNRALVNARTASRSLKDFAGNTINIKGAALDDATDVETGERKTVGYLVLEDGTVLSTISNTALDAINGIVDIITDEGCSLSADVVLRKSHAGRDFLTISIRE